MDGLLLIAKKSRNILREKILANDESPYEAVGVRKNGSEYQLLICKLSSLFFSNFLRQLPMFSHYPDNHETHMYCQSHGAC